MQLATPSTEELGNACCTHCPKTAQVVPCEVTVAVPVCGLLLVPFNTLLSILTSCIIQLKGHQSLSTRKIDY
jgi:hypothetical protein